MQIKTQRGNDATELPVIGAKPTRDATFGAELKKELENTNSGYHLEI